MPLQCGCCGKFISSLDAAKCKKCNTVYRRACMSLPTNGSISPSWQCVDCKKRTKADNVPKISVAKAQTVATEQNDLDVRDDEFVDTCSPSNLSITTPLSTEELVRELKAFRAEQKTFSAELLELKEELREYRREVCDLSSSVETINKRVDNMEERMVALENRQIATPPNSVVSQLERTIVELKLELNDREQESFNSDLEIANLPEERGENLIHTVGLIAVKLGVALQEHDIAFAHRVGIRAEAADEVGPAGGASAAVRARRVVVRVARRELRDQLLQGARTRRGATTDGLGLSQPPRRFYLNERLTRSNKHLLYRAREAAGSVGWKYTWTKHGRILSKQGDGKKTFWIRSEEDLERVFCRDNITVNDN